jgi:diguanylate cyclase (GGDEF)-like protein
LRKRPQGAIWAWKTGTGRRGGAPIAHCRPKSTVSLVSALYNDFRSLFVGAIAASGTALITAYKSGEPLLYVCSAMIALVACARGWDVSQYQKRRARIVGLDEAAQWERRYVAGAAAHVMLLGMWCLVAFIKTSDPFVQIFSFALTLAYMIGISGRNFASNLLVLAQIVCAGVPMTAALLLVGGWYYAIFAFVLIPFFASLKFISDRLRRVLLDAVIAGRDVSLLAGRFDTALNNMPHGLCMVDLKGQIVVCNRRLRELLSLPENVTRRRLPVRALINEAAAAAALSCERAERLALALESRLAGSADGEVLIDTEHQRMLAITVNPMAEGGAVLLFEDVTDRQIAEAKIHQLARFDTLTGLPNRAFLHDQTEAALAALKRRGPFAILFVDLDDFKQVNDTLGHTCGDALLCAVADRLRSVVRGSDMVARFGGDEFVVLQYPLGDLDESAALAEQIVDVLGGAFQINGHQIVVGASIGIAVAPRDGDSADLLLKNADMALYRVKLNGRGSCQFFEQGMDVKAHARRNLQLDLRNALAADAFKVHYQPLYNLRTKRIATCEALLRWPHPERGMVPPGEFIPIAEEMGLIVEIGRLVLRKASIECARWPNDVRVAVNLSAIQFRRDDMANTIREALQAAKLAPDRLEIEITESAFLDDSEVTRLWLDQLQDLGVRISLDDFGTGYSSLSYLHSFPLNKVKIDRSFLQGLQASSRSLSLLYGVARLSAELDLAVTVEGVETREQLALIARERSITEVQGFYIGSAVPAEEIRGLLFSPQSQMDRVA